MPVDDNVDFLIDNWSLLLIAVASGGMLMWPAISRASGAGGLTPNAAVLKINREKAIVIDVSEPEEFAQGHVAGARNLPFGQVEEKIADLAKNKAVPVILTCPAGARANRAQSLLRKLGYEQAQALSGGTRAWREANLPIEKA